MKLSPKNYYNLYQKATTLAIALTLVGSFFTYQAVKAQISSNIDNVDNKQDTTTCPFPQIPQTNSVVVEVISEQPSEEEIMKTWVLNRIQEAGLDPNEASIIVNCESRWNPDAMGVNGNRTVDLGLWQINSIHKDISNSDKLDYKKATDWAIDKRVKDGQWLAWSCSRKLARK